MSGDTALVDKWKVWLERIDADLFELAQRRNVFKRVGEIFHANPAIQKPRDFHDLITSGYGAYVCMALRRLCERQNTRADREIVSVRALLEEFVEYPEVPSRQRIRDERESRQGRPLDDRQLAQMERGWAGARWMGRDHACPVCIQGDIDRLAAECEPIKTLVDKQLAHNDSKDLYRSVPFDQLHGLLASLEDIAALCHAYLLGPAFGGRDTPYTVAMTEDWEAVLRVPWIPAHAEE